MSIRLRLAVVFTVGAAVLFALGALLFVVELSSGLLGSLDTQLTADLSLAPTLAASPAHDDGSSLAVPGQVVVQVFDRRGRLHASSAGSGEGRLLTAAQLSQARSGRIAFSTTLDEQSERVVARPLSGHPGWVAAAGTSLATVNRSLGDVRLGLVLAGMLVLLGAGLGSYALARAALSPVERLRREVALLAERGSEAALPVPETKDELAALASTMNELLALLHESLSRQRAFVADAGHELRTPFAVLQGELELAARPGREPGEVAAALSRASEETGRLVRLANDLLVLARSDTHQLDVEPVRVEVAAWLARSTAAFAVRAEAAGVRLRTEVSPGLQGLFDPQRARQAIDNLLDNALKFAPAGSQIRLRAAPVAGEDGGGGAGTSGGVALEVSDAGPGFPPEYLPHAFERFSRPDSSRARSQGGTGLGLAIVQAIALAHGGTATARNAPGGGAVVAVTFPDAAERRSGAAPTRLHAG